MPDIYTTWELYDPRNPDSILAVLSVYPTARNATLKYGENTYQLNTLNELSLTRLRAPYSAGRFQGTLDAKLDASGQLDVRFTGTVDARLKGRVPVQPKPVATPAPARWTPSGNPVEDLIRDFETRTWSSAFPNVSRAEVAKGLRERVSESWRINQAHTWMCGPAAFIYSFATDKPLEYVQYVTQVYDQGIARLGNCTIMPSSGFRSQHVSGGAPAVDWIALGSLRDSSNWMFDYEYNSWAEHLRGGTTTSEVASWFRKAGYSDVQDWTEGHGRMMNARLANQFYRQGYKVCLSIDADMLGDENTAQSRSLVANHFVVLTSPIEISDDGVKFTVYTWRSPSRQVPLAGPGEPGKMPQAVFLSKYYGFIAAKP